MAGLSIPFLGSRKPESSSMSDGSKSPLAGSIGSSEAPDGSDFICDPRFEEATRRVIDLWLFLIESRAIFEDNNRLNPSDIQALIFTQVGRLATKEEWARVNWLYQVLNQHISPELVRQRRNRASYRAIGALPVYAMAGCIVGFSISVASLLMLDNLHSNMAKIFGFLIWTIGLGALGSSAFLAVNTLGDRSDSKFDISESGLIRIRVVLGSIFGFVLAVPISMPTYRKFIDGLAARAEIDSNVVLGVILPFLLGFSTSLVLTILDRLISAVDALFGVRPNASSSGQSSLSPSTPLPPIAQGGPPPIGSTTGGSRKRPRR